MSMTRPVAEGALAARGLIDAETARAADALLAKVAASDLETVRVLFVDQHGILRGKTLVASALASTFSAGVAAPSTLLLKDTSHRTVFDVWSRDAGIASGPMQGANDVLLVPDPATFHALPWAPHSAWIFCDVVHKSGAAIPFASRTVLATAIDRLAQAGLTAVMGLEVEFHIYRITNPRLDHAGATMPGQPPETEGLNQGYQFLTETRYNEAEPILDLLRRHALALGLPVRSVEIEMGPNQFEFTFDPAGPMEHAANMVMFRTMVKEVCAAQGLHATFMAKPKIENTFASGWHIHQSLLDGQGRNVFIPDQADVLTPHASGWIAGLLAHASESCLLTGPTVNSYKRFQPFQLAPNRIQWAQDNRGAMVRALMGPGDAASRVENRVADTTANPYFAFAAQLLSGLAGLEQSLAAPAPVEEPYASAAALLPTNLGEAIDAFEKSTLYRSALGDGFVDYLTHVKRAEWARYLGTVSDWEQAEYFSLY
jgi:glutamine synthetase